MKLLWTFLSILVVVMPIAGLRVATDSTCRCGQRKYSAFGQFFGTRVVGGKEAEVNEFPWAALLSIHSKGKKPVRCGGSLVNDRYVVTAAHCIPLSAQMDITVYLGEHSTVTKLETTTLKTRAKLYRYHKHYSYHLDEEDGILIYDLALLELSDAVDWARYPHIRPVCLPDERDVDYDGDLATLVGWGNDLVHYEVITKTLIKGVPSGRVSKSLQKLDVSLMSQDKCRDVFKEAKLPIQISESNLCAVSQLGDSCAGDSGGGVVRMSQDGYYELVGIVSYGVGCNSSSNGLKIPGVNHRVSKAVNWIKHLTDGGVFCQKEGISGQERKRQEQEKESKRKQQLQQQSQFENQISQTPVTGWSEWEPFTSCDRSCGYGKKYRDRYCRGSSCTHTQQTQERVCWLRSC